MANDNVHGLSGNVWSQSVNRAIEVAKQMRTGMVLINDSALISNKAHLENLNIAVLEESLEKHIIKRCLLNNNILTGCTFSEKGAYLHQISQ